MPCAVFGTEPAKRFSIEVCQVEEDGATSVHCIEANLGYRALDRLLQKINQGVKPPAKRKGKADG